MSHLSGVDPGFSKGGGGGGEWNVWPHIAWLWQGGGCHGRCVCKFIFLCHLHLFIAATVVSIVAISASLHVQ